MDLRVSSTAGTATWAGVTFPCALGRTGVTAAKTEGDGATPAGRFVMHRGVFRADRVDRPATPLPFTAIAKTDGWCDAPDHPAYNQPVTLPFAASHEVMWRADRLYDVVVILGHNDNPPRPGAGSAIFLHVAAPDYAATQGCVALALPDLLAVLATADATSAVTVAPA